LLLYSSITLAGAINPAGFFNLVRRPIMADTIRGKLAEAGNAISETAQKVGNKISEKAEEAKDWAKEKANKARNRADEASEKAENEAEVARQDEKAKEGNCGCS
jgi:ABC-type Zn uptake system ZnuABC Zn-binding protein ZnuA